MVLMLDGAPQMVEEFHVSGTAQTKHKMHVRLRHLKTGRITEQTLPDGERLPIADVQHRRVQLSYADGKDFVFSEVESFEELTLSAERVGDRRYFIKENVEYRALLLDGRLLDIELPANVTFEVVETAPPVSGGSVPRGNPPDSTTVWKSWSPCSSPPAKKSAWTRPNGNTPAAKTSRKSNEGQDKRL